MTISTNGTFVNNTGAAGVSTVSLTTTATHDVWCLSIGVGTTGATITALSGGGVTTWHQVGSTVSDTTAGGTYSLWWGVTTATGTNTLTYTISGTLGTHQIQTSAQEFTSTLGASANWTGDGGSCIDVTGAGQSTITWPTLTPTGTGELYYGGTLIAGGATAGSTPGFTYKIDGFADAICWNTSVSAAATPTATQTTTSGTLIGAMLLQEAPPSSGLSSLLNPPPTNRARLVRASCF